MENEGNGLFSREFLKNWYSNYTTLETYVKQQEFGAGDLDKKIIQWLEIQRRIQHLLPVELKDKLIRLNFDDREISHSWNSMYRSLADFVQTHGHAYLPPNQEHEDLKDWLVRQVINKRLLSDSQCAKLSRLEIDWDMHVSREQNWHQMYARLEDFYRAFGHCRVPNRWKNDKQLALWVTLQRRMHTQGKLRAEREQMLQELNFVWSIQDVYESQWEEFFQQLFFFYEEHGHCRVPFKHEKLVKWIERQRIAKKKKLLLPGREMRLCKINFIWSCDGIKKQKWEDRYRQLQDFKQQYGHCFVSANRKECKTLGKWVATQRLLEANGRLHVERKKKLDRLGFVWSRDTHQQLKVVYDTLWNDNFNKLRTYKQEHATCQVSLKVDPLLQRWTVWQRKLFCQGKLLQERIDKLNELRFPWSVQESYWLSMYEALCDFKTLIGHTRVPSQWEKNPQLSVWVFRMRVKKAELGDQKVELLNQLEFDWAVSKKNVVTWEEMYERLVRFEQEHGHTRVPVQWKKDRKLGKWVSRMRQEKENLEPGRFFLLERLKFYWGRQTILKEGGARCKHSLLINYGG